MQKGEEWSMYFACGYYIYVCGRQWTGPNQL